MATIGKIFNGIWQVANFAWTAYFIVLAVVFAWFIFIW
jgi:hypothetical protein